MKSLHRPFGVSLLAGLFAFGVLASATATVSLLWPGGWLEAIWRVNPRGHAAFQQLGALAYVLLVPLCIACSLAALGFVRARRWGYWLGLLLLGGNLIGNLLNGISGAEPRAWVGVPIVSLAVWYLFRPHVRAYFGFAPLVA